MFLDIAQSPVAVVLLILTFFCLSRLIETILIDSLGKIPGPKAFALTEWRLAYEDWTGRRTRTIDALHRKYGPVVRIGPKEIAFNSLTALRTIYGAGSGFERTTFYRMFDVYGRQNLFTFSSVKAHGERKKLLAHAYSKSVMLKGSIAALVEQKVQDYLALIERADGRPVETFSTLHYFSIDAITDFVYGKHGKTAAVNGSEDRALLNDILDHSRRRLSWFAVHFPAFTKWMYSQTGQVEKILKPLLPMQKPSTYTGIRAHALKAWLSFKAASPEVKAEAAAQGAIMARLWKHHQSQKEGGLTDMDIASECADHLLAGIDTTSDSLMFLFWALSRPVNRNFQDKLTEEVSRIPSEDINTLGVPSVESSSKLKYVDAVIMETLRLYAPLPASEPRSLPTDCVVDGYAIPSGTVVSMAPHSLHRNPQVFDNPLEFCPDRWLGDSAKAAEMKKWFWAFSSGGRMCIGMHLAMAEMTTLVAAVYRQYSTSIATGCEDVTPGITSRFEVFYDDRFPHVTEHECYVRFERRS